MADVASNLNDWSTTASSNSPTDATTIGSGLADNFQQIQATVRAHLANKGSDIASATTTDLGGTTGFYHDITGTTTITSFGSTNAGAGIWKILQFDGSLTLTHNASSLILPGGANITTVAGDHCIAVSLGGGNWAVPFYGRAQVSATLVNLSDPGADRLLFWDDSESKYDHASLTGLSISATTLSVDVASQAEMETASSTAKMVTPGRQHFHPSAAKIWVSYYWSSGTPTIQLDYNVTSLTDTSAGVVTINFDITLSSTNYAIVTQGGANNATNVLTTRISSQGTTSCQTTTQLTESPYTAADATSVLGLAIFGDI